MWLPGVSAQAKYRDESQDVLGIDSPLEYVYRVGRTSRHGRGQTLVVRTAARQASEAVIYQQRSSTRPLNNLSASALLNTEREMHWLGVQWDRDGQALVGVTVDCARHCIHIYPIPISLSYPR